MNGYIQAVRANSLSHGCCGAANTYAAKTSTVPAQLAGGGTAKPSALNPSM